MPISSDTGAFSFRANVKPAAGEQVRARHVNDPLEDVQNALNGSRPIQRGGTAASTASGARTNLGVAIGSDVQAHSAKLDAIAGLTWADGKILTGAGTNTIKGLTFRNRNDLGGSSPDSSGAVSEAAAKAYVDAKDSATRSYADDLVPDLAGSGGGLARSGGDLTFSNGTATIDDNAVGYDELNAGTGTTGQALVKTASGIGFANVVSHMARGASRNYAASMEWNGLPPGIVWFAMLGQGNRVVNAGTGLHTMKAQLGTAQGWSSVSFSMASYTAISARIGNLSGNIANAYQIDDNYGMSGELTRIRVVWSGNHFTNNYYGSLRLFYMIGA